MSNNKDVPNSMVMNRCYSLIFQGFGLGVQNRHTDSHVTAKIFEIDGLPNSLRYGAPLKCLQLTGAPARLLSFYSIFSALNKLPVLSLTNLFPGIN